MNRLLAPHIHMALFGRDLLILNTQDGRYDLVAGGAIDVTLDASGQAIAIRDAQLDDLLSRAGIFTEEMELKPRTPLPRLPTRSALDGSPIRIAPEDRRSLATAWIDMVRHYYGRGLPKLIAYTADMRDRHNLAPAPLDPSSDLLKLTAVFNHVSPWIPFQGDCVFRCFMLLCWLRRRGFSQPCWVFAVKTWPFYAHCWLQDGDIVLTDFAEPLVSFSPIFAV